MTGEFDSSSPGAVRLPGALDTRQLKLSASTVQPASPLAAAGRKSGGFSPRCRSLPSSPHLRPAATAPDEEAPPPLLALLAASLPSQADNDAAGDSPEHPHRTTQQLLQAANGGPYPSGTAHDGSRAKPPKRGGVFGFLAGRGGSSAAGSSAPAHEGKGKGSNNGGSTTSNWFGRFSRANSQELPPEAVAGLDAAAAAAAEGERRPSGDGGSTGSGSSGGPILGGLPFRSLTPPAPEPLRAASPALQSCLLPGASGGSDDSGSRGAAGAEAQPRSSEEGTEYSASCEPSPVTQLLGLPAPDAAAAAAGKGHRRHRSLTSLLKFRTKKQGGAASGGSSEEVMGHSRQGSLEAGEVGTPPNESALSPSGKSPAGRGAPGRSAGPSPSLSCFGLGSRQPDADAEAIRSPGQAPDPEASLDLDVAPLLPPGTLGIRNTGNTCFINAALQCLRYTPGLPQQLVPGLLELAAQQAQQAADAAAAAPPEPPLAPVDVHALVRASIEPGKPAVPAPEEVAAAALAEAAAGAPAAPDAAGSPGEAPAEGAAAEAGPLEAAANGGQQSDEAAAAARPPKLERPPRGTLLAAVGAVVQELYLKGGSEAVDPVPLLAALRRFPLAASYFDGGQHDCQEVLRVLLDLLHDDQNQAVPEPPYGEEEEKEAAVAAAEVDAGAAEPAGAPAEAAQASPDPGSLAEPAALGPETPEAPSQLPPRPASAEDESAKAERSWQEYAARNRSPVADLFGGQLQSSVTCHSCGGVSTMYEPFHDLSLPLAPRESKGGGLAWLGVKAAPASIQDCLALFASDEKMEGDEAFHCERCGEKRAATKRLRVQRFPDALVLHIKRFRYKAGFAGGVDKLGADVSFPLRGLRLGEYASPTCGAAPADCVYDLYAVSNHAGTLHGGHYTAMCRVPQRGGGAWYAFNDESVTRIDPGSVVSQYAYILFYVRRRYRLPSPGPSPVRQPPLKPAGRGSAEEEEPASVAA